MVKRFLIICSLYGFISSCFTSTAVSMPFSPDPKSFGGYLSYTNWGDPSLTIRFEHLGNCTYDYSYGVETYSCKTGYAVISDAYSKQKCRIQAVYNGTNSSYDKYECRDLKVPEKVQREALVNTSPSSRMKRAFNYLFGN